MYQIKQGDKMLTADNWTEAEKKFKRLSRANPEEYTRLFWNGVLIKVHSAKIEREARE